MDELLLREDDRYTPFVSTLSGDLEGAMSALFGPGPITWQDRAMHRSGDPLAILFSLPGQPSMQFELGTPSRNRRAFYSGRHVTLSYRLPRDQREASLTPEQRDFAEAVRRRVQSADRSELPVIALRDALVRLRAFEPISDWMYRQTSPRDALIRLGFRCNQDCWFCWQGRDWPEPPVALYHRWLEEMADDGHTRVSFSGGEPTLHRELPALVAKAVDLGLTPWIQTNAIQLSKPKLLERLMDAGLVGAFVSYHSPDAETSDRLTRAPGTHERTRAGIRASLGAGLSVHLNCVVERENYRQLTAHADDVLRSFVDPFPHNPVTLVHYSHPCEYYDPDVWRRSAVPLDEVRHHLVGALRRLHSRGVGVEGIGTCGFPPCLLRDEPALLRWLAPHEQHAMDVAGRSYVPECDRCVVKSRCLGLRKETLELLGSAGIVAFETIPELPADASHSP